MEATKTVDRREQRAQLQAMVQEQMMTRWRATLGWVLVLAGGLAVLLAWWQVRDLPDVALQMPYLISGGLGGALLMALGGALMLSQDFRDDKERMSALEDRIGELEGVVVRQAELVGRAVELLTPTTNGRRGAGTSGGSSRTAGGSPSRATRRA